MATSKNNDAKSNVRCSIKLLMIRHAESRNNEVYRNARYIYRGGTPDFDLDGWTHYVETHRSSDPGLSEIGSQQSKHLADFLVPYLSAHASAPVKVISSPMRRTLETIRPTMQQLHEHNGAKAAELLVNAFYFESEGCHTQNVAESGMAPSEITSLIQETNDIVPSDNIQFNGFPSMEEGWYAHGTAAETRSESEVRAAKFYLWLCEYLDQQLATSANDLFDAGAEESHIQRGDSLHNSKKRRTALLVGHGDFMSLVLKRVVAGFGHYVENEGIPHRSAFVHFNTGISELEYFGKGRFLVMSHNQTPHFSPVEYEQLRTGGGLKDGWSYLMPNDEFLLDAEVSVAFLDELENHVIEQATALKSLYLSSEASDKFHTDNGLSIEEEDDVNDSKEHVKHFVVKHGLQVVGVATYSEKTGRLTDVAVRPSGGKEASETLFEAVKQYSKKLGRSGSLLITPRSVNNRAMFESMGFEELGDESSPDTMQLKH
jgi:broad specificity phosphatase PhoE